MSALTIVNEEKEDRSQVEETEEETLPSALLREKNQEIDHLNYEIQRLEQALENAGDNKVRVSIHTIPVNNICVHIVECLY